MSFSAIHRIMKISCNLRFTAFNKKYKKKQSILKITTKSIIYGNKKQKKKIVVTSRGLASMQDVSFSIMEVGTASAA